MLNGFCDIFILRENLKIENNKICKKILPTEKIGIIAYKSLFEKYNKIDVLIINEFLILKEINYQKEAFSYIEKNYDVKVKNKRTITNIDLFIGLLNGCGYTLNNNDYFNKIGGVSNGFIFIHPSDLCFSNRYVYFLNNTPWMEYIYDFIGSSD